MDDLDFCSFRRCGAFLFHFIVLIRNSFSVEGK